MTEIGTLGGDFSSGYRIDEKGRVFGCTPTVPGNIFDRPAGRPFVWEKGELKPIGSEGSRVEVINESGLRVGARGDLATIWINGKPTDLNKLITSADGMSFDLASELNAGGFIVLHGSHYLATPKSSHRDQHEIDAQDPSHVRDGGRAYVGRCQNRHPDLDPSDPVH